MFIASSANAVAVVQWAEPAVVISVNPVSVAAISFFAVAKASRINKILSCIFQTPDNI